jgi:hypothetical protein
MGRIMPDPAALLALKAALSLAARPCFTERLQPFLDSFPERLWHDPEYLICMHDPFRCRLRELPTWSRLGIAPCLRCVPEPVANVLFVLEDPIHGCRRPPSSILTLRDHHWATANGVMTKSPLAKQGKRARTSLAFRLATSTRLSFIRNPPDEPLAHLHIARVLHANGQSFCAHQL